MDWSNERYVRIYVRDTDDLLAMSWEARALLWEMMRKADRAGVLETRRGARGIAALTRIPAEVVALALAELLDGDGAPVKPHPRGYLLRNFMEAQEANQSDAHRAREARARRRDRALAEEATGSTEGQNVTSRDDAVTFRDASVTPSHAPSHGVTARHSDPSVPSVPNQPDCAHGVSAESDELESTPKPKKRAKPRIALPDDWQPRPVEITRAAAASLDVNRETERFRNHAAQNDRRCANWDAAFRNWLLAAEERKGAPGLALVPAHQVAFDPRAKSRRV